MKKHCQIPEVLTPAEGHEPEPELIVDGRLRFGGGSWCYMCTACHALHGVGLGTGNGQKFKQVQKDGDWRLEKA